MARPIGSKNEKTKQWDAFGRELISGGMPRLQRILDECDDDTFIKVYIPLLEYFRPKLKRIEQATTDQIVKIDVMWDDIPERISSNRDTK